MTFRQLVRRVLRWPWVVGTLVAVVLLTTAAGGSVPITIESVAVGIAGGMLWWNWRTTMEHRKAVDKSFGRIETALFGPEDGDGKRPLGGLVRQGAVLVEQCGAIPELTRKVDHAAVLAAMAAREVRAFQNAQRKAQGLDPLPDINMEIV